MSVCVCVCGPHITCVVHVCNILFYIDWTNSGCPICVFKSTLVMESVSGDVVCVSDALFVTTS